MWFDARHYRITSSILGHILSRRADTPPDNVVIQPRIVWTPATKYGIENEQVALKKYIACLTAEGHPDIAVSPSGFHICAEHPFLGALPEGSVYDPSHIQQPFGFLEIKCPYTWRLQTPAEACGMSGFCCSLDTSVQSSCSKRVILIILRYKVRWPLESARGVTLLLYDQRDKHSIR